jgi:predicted MFS family arabinose efflux permease
MRLLLVTQGAAGTLCVLSWFAGTLPVYWVLTMAMFMCKSSYLLMYPYLMRRLPPEEHGHTIGLLSVLVYAGGIVGAVAGGFALQHLGPASCIGLMAAGDFAQMAVCAWLVGSGRIPPAAAHDAAHAPAQAALSRRRILQLCGLVMLVDFSAYLVRPFFALHWERVSGSAEQLVSGAAFAIPGAVALLALFANQHWRRRGRRVPDRLLPNLLLGAAGLALQAVPIEAAVLGGRFVYGWAVFQLIVKLEVLLFRFSTPSSYARDFSVFNFFRNLGVLVSSFAAGALVERHGLAMTFAVAAIGFAAAAVIDRGWLRIDRHPTPAPEGSASLTAHHAH